MRDTRTTLNSFDRKQLFEEVWAAPMKHVGKKYGISGAEVRRICDALLVPVPARGHWTLVAHGRAGAPPALVPVSTVAPAVEADASGSQNSSSGPAAARARGAAFGVGLPAELHHWHRALYGLRQQMETDTARADRLKKAHDWEQAHPGKHHPPDGDATYASWLHFCDAGQLLLTTTHRKLVARLSLGSYKRGLKLLNAICHLADRTGYAVDMVKGEERLRLSKAGAHVDIRVSEKLVKGTRYQINSWNRSRESVRTLAPTGKLALFIEQQGTGHTELADRADQPLEQQIDSVLAAIDHRHHGSVRGVAEREERERQSKEAKIKRLEQERKQRETWGKAEEANRDRQALVSEAENWRQALSMLDTKLGRAAELRDEYFTWRKWALAVADDLDPTFRRISLRSRPDLV